MPELTFTKPYKWINWASSKEKKTSRYEIKQWKGRNIPNLEGRLKSSVIRLIECVPYDWYL